MIPGRGTGTTVTGVDWVFELPAASVTTPVTRKTPVLPYVCDAMAEPVTAPRSVVPPSPQLTLRSRTALPFVAAGVTTKVKFAGSPTLGAGEGGVIRRIGAAEMLTITEPDA